VESVDNDLRAKRRAASEQSCGTSEESIYATIERRLAEEEASGDALDFDAKFPSVTPYLGLGYGHRTGAGLQLYADAGVAYGRPKVTLSPTASLAAKVSPTDLAAEQVSVQDKADRYRTYPVLKIGLSYGF